MQNLSGMSAEQRVGPRGENRKGRDNSPADPATPLLMKEEEQSHHHKR